MAMSSQFYFHRFESRRPPEPLPRQPKIELLWQVLALLALLLGARYLHWRWTHSINWDAVWFSVPLVIGETCAYIGLILYVINLWKTKEDACRLPSPPLSFSDCVNNLREKDRPISVDIFITTYNENEELVRLSIRDAKNVRYPYEIEIKVHVLDDGDRPVMHQVAVEEGVNYIRRDDKRGFKAGNLCNAMAQTSGDFIVICDADTRLFPTMLERTMGYFHDPNMAFVQTPQWFFDLPLGQRLPAWLHRRAGRIGKRAGRLIEKIFGEIRMDDDPFGNDPTIFYGVIQRRRNVWNAAFCCGAASIHRREAVMEVATHNYDKAVRRASRRKKWRWRIPLRLRRKKYVAIEPEIMPFKFHVSEDLYTSIAIHQHRKTRWKSVLHPWIESKMLSPQDLLTWTIQRFKYAGGSLDIFIHDNPIIKPGLSFGQRLMYLTTFWSYLGATWSLMFLLAPIIYMTTGISPMQEYAHELFEYAVPFLVVNELALMFGTWGVSSYKGKNYYVSGFPISLRALWAVLRKQEITFHVTPKLRQSGFFIRLVWPQIAIVVLTLLAIIWMCVSFTMQNNGYTLGGIFANGLWSFYNIIAMLVIIRAAFWNPGGEMAR
jgi:cellulose synthase (UDP-forming)